MPDTGSGFSYLRSGADRAAGPAQTAPKQPEPESMQQPEIKQQPEAEPQPEPETQQPEASVSPADDYPTDGTIPDVKDWVGEDAQRAQAAYDREQDRPNGPRSTLLDYLSDLLPTKE